MPTMYKIFFAFYAFLWKIALLFLHRHKRVKDGFQQRQIPDGWLEQDLSYAHDHVFEKNPDKPFFGDISNKKKGKYTTDIWIQAASGGEAYLACELIKALPKKDIGNKPYIYSILVTTWTRQGLQILTQECEKLMANFDEKYAPIIQIRFAPLDTYEIMQRALKQANPKVCIMLETELWPNFMLVCKEWHIPFYVVNGRMTKSSFELYKIIAPVLNYVAPKHILAMTKDDMQRFSHIFSSSLVRFMPNIKFDKAAQLVQAHFDKTESSDLANSIHQKQSFITKNDTEVSTPGLIKFSCENQTQEASYLEQKKYLSLLPTLFDHAQKTFLFASIRQEEENYFASLLWRIYSKRPRDIFIIAPRHMHRVKQWRRRFYDLGIKFVLASEFFNEAKYCENSYLTFEPNTCVIWDIFGDLPQLYAYTDVAIVGGSFKKLGGQNFLEAIACGANVHVGTYIDNFLWALGEDLAVGENSAPEITQEMTQNITQKNKQASSQEYIDNLVKNANDKNTEQNVVKETVKQVNKEFGSVVSKFFKRDDFLQNKDSLIDIGLLHMHTNKKSLETILLQENICKKTMEERLEIQEKLSVWLEKRCGGSALAMEKIIESEYVF